MNLKNIALFDMDGTLVDYHKGMFEQLKRILPDEEYSKLPEDMHNNLPDWLYNLKQLIYNQPYWWRDLEKIKTGFEVFNMAKEIGYDIRILTKGPLSSPNSWKEKVEWCKMHIPGIKITVTEDKSLVYGKVLVDDFPDYVLSWLEYRPRGLVIMPEHDYNKDFKHPNVIHYDGTNKDEVKQALITAFDRPARKDLDI
ncbi:hypothetical protein KAR91_00495 [Candidatus Pacearchaeota archaeon]|nr:hypothetical protein [Candidatus Pacearchaeota archaeon]